MTLRILLPFLFFLSACQTTPKKIDEAAPVAQRTGLLQAKTNAIRQLDIEQFIGDIRVTPTDKQEIRVNYRIDLHSVNSDQASQLLEKIKPVLQTSGDRLKLYFNLDKSFPTELLLPRATFKLGYFIGSGSTRSIRYQQREFQLKSRPTKNSPAFFVHFELEVPAGIALKVQQSLGNFYASQLRNSLELSSPAGQIYLDELQQANTHITAAKQLKISRYQGDISITNSGDEVWISDIQGQIKAQHHGELFRLNNMQGSLQLNSQGGKVHLQQLIGPVSIQSTFADVELKRLQGSLRYKSHNGSLKLSQTDGDLDLSSYNGTIALENGIQTKHLQIFTDRGTIQLQQWPELAQHIEIRNRSGLLQSPVSPPESCKPQQTTLRQHCYVDSSFSRISPITSSNLEN